MASVTEHYEGLLAPVYVWMVGDLPAAFARSRAELAAAGLGAGDGSLALDLGAGFGLQAIPLAERGHEVVAIDTSATLLGELARLAPPGAPIRAVHDDLVRLRAHAPRPCAVITCLGDTLPHLSTQTEVARVLDEAAALLAPGGRLLLGFRDYHASPLEGPARFIPVRSDADRILTCFLEYDQEQVMVHDLLHERRGPSWDLRVGSYRKLRLDPRWVADRLRAAGLAVRELPRLRGMVTIVGQRVA